MRNLIGLILCSCLGAAVCAAEQSASPQPGGLWSRLRGRSAPRAAQTPPGGKNHKMPTHGPEGWDSNVPRFVTPKQLNDDDLARRRADAEKIEEHLREDVAALERMRHNLTPADLPCLTEIIHNPLNPFAADAVAIAARHYGREFIRPLIRRALDAPQATAQNAALTALVTNKDSAAANAARRFLHAPDARLRLTAILACGELRITSAGRELREILQTANPGLRLHAAAALLRLGYDEDARTYLESIARHPTEQTAPLALRYLGLVPDARTVGFCFALLPNDNPRIAGTAAAMLRHLPTPLVTQAQSAMPDEIRTLTAARRDLWKFLQTEEKELPLAAARTLALFGTATDAALFVNCWEKKGDPRALPALLQVVAHAPSAISTRALNMVLKFLNDSPQRYADPPRDLRNAAAWEKWWFRQQRLLAAMPGRALIRLPFGGSQEIAVGDSLEFGATVRAIIPGRGTNGTQGGKVEISGSATYLILP